MRIPLAITVVLLAVPLAAQTIDLHKWTVEDFAGPGKWNKAKLFAEFLNNNVYDISVLYSDTNISLINFELKVGTTADDDIIGFVLGFQPGDSKNQNADYLVVDWKQTTQSYQDWGTAKAGLAVSRMKGVGTVSTRVPGIIDLWSHTRNCKELARGTKYGSTGWADNTTYQFRVLYTTSSLTIWVDGVQEFKLSGSFKTGRFGCYNFSQPYMQFRFPSQGSITPFGQSCKGSNGNPSLVAPRPPLVGRDFFVVAANLPAQATSSFVVGLSNKTWGAVSLPFNMGLIGGTGCTLYTSAEAFLPFTNQNGTGTLILPIPNDTNLARLTFYCQAMVHDSSANPLGLVMSNAATAVVGN